MVSAIEVKTHFGPFQGFWDNINAENVAKLKLAHFRGFSFVCLMIPNQRVLIYSRKGVRG